MPTVTVYSFKLPHIADPVDLTFNDMGDVAGHLLMRAAGILKEQGGGLSRPVRGHLLPIEPEVTVHIEKGAATGDEDGILIRAESQSLPPIWLPLDRASARRLAEQLLAASEEDELG